MREVRNVMVRNPEAEAGRLVDTYADMIRRICYSYLRSVADSEDICQDVLLKTLVSDKEFSSPDHEKAWIIRVTINACKDLARKASRINIIPFESGLDVPDTDDEFAAVETDATNDVMSAVDSLPDTYRTSIYLRYYEGYSSKEIAELTGQSVSAVDKQLSRGRKLLKTQLEGEYA